MNQIPRVRKVSPSLEDGGVERITGTTMSSGIFFTIEVHLGIVCCCLPMMRPRIRRIASLSRLWFSKLSRRHVRSTSGAREARNYTLIKRDVNSRLGRWATPFPGTLVPYLHVVSILCNSRKLTSQPLSFKGRSDRSGPIFGSASPMPKVSTSTLRPSYPFFQTHLWPEFHLYFRLPRVECYFSATVPDTFSAIQDTFHSMDTVKAGQSTTHNMAKHGDSPHFALRRRISARDA